MKLLFILLAVLTLLPGCHTHSSADLKKDVLEKNKATALSVQQYFNNHDANSIMRYMAADMIDYGDGSGPPAKGAEAKAFLQAYFMAFPDIKCENVMAIAEGNQVAVFADWTGTFKGEMMGIKPTGKAFKVKDVDLFTFNEEGKITEHHSVQSSETNMRQVGAVKAN